MVDVGHGCMCSTRCDTCTLAVLPFVDYNCTHMHTVSYSCLNNEIAQSLRMMPRSSRMALRFILACSLAPPSDL